MLLLHYVRAENAASGHGHRWGHIWTAERQLHQRFLSRVHASLLTHGREALHANAARKEDRSYLDH